MHVNACHNPTRYACRFVQPNSVRIIVHTKLMYMEWQFNAHDVMMTLDGAHTTSSGVCVCVCVTSYIFL